MKQTLCSGGFPIDERFICAECGAPAGPRSRCRRPDAKYLYRPTLRPASSFTLPHGLRWEYVQAPWEGVSRPDLPRADTRYGVISTDRQLTADERQQFDLQSI